MSPVSLVAAAVGFLLLGFMIQRKAQGTGGGKLWGCMPMLLTALCLLVTGSLMLRYNTGEDTISFLIWFFASAVLLFLLVGMAAGRLVGRILDEANP